MCVSISLSKHEKQQLNFPREKKRIICKIPKEKKIQ